MHDANFVRLTHCTKGYGVPWTMEEMKLTSVGRGSAVHALEIVSAERGGCVAFDAVAVKLP